MKKRMIIGLAVSMALLMGGVSVFATATDEKVPVEKTPVEKTRAFVDADGDGVCDNTGNGNGNGNRR